MPEVTAVHGNYVKNQDWLFRRIDLLHLLTIVKLYYNQYYKEVAKQLDAQYKFRKEYVKLFPFRRRLEQAFHQFSSLSCAFNHLSNWRN